MRPKRGTNIYYICEGQILQYTVEYLGSESFIVEEYADIIKGEFTYKSYGTVWFDSLESAINETKRIYGENIKIEHPAPFMWEVSDDD